MDWELIKPWVNRVGIMLEFLSFWLAAPEILGEERLRKLERRLEGGIRVLPLMASCVAIVVTMVLMMAVVWLVGGVSSETEATVVLAMAAVVAAVGLEASAGRMHLVTVVAVVAVMTALLVVAVAVGLLAAWKAVAFLVAVAAGVGLLMVAMAVGIALVSKLEDRVVLPLLRVLADDKRIRQRSLAVGAVLFVVGFLLQLISTF